jgi:hypothetical protein
MLELDVGSSQTALDGGLIILPALTQAQLEGLNRWREDKDPLSRGNKLAYLLSALPIDF